VTDENKKIAVFKKVEKSVEKQIEALRPSGSMLLPFALYLLK